MPNFLDLTRAALAAEGWQAPLFTPASSAFGRFADLVAIRPDPAPGGAMLAVLVEPRGRMIRRIRHTRGEPGLLTWFAHGGRLESWSWGFDAAGRPVVIRRPLHADSMTGSPADEP